MKLIIDISQNEGGLSTAKAGDKVTIIDKKGMFVAAGSLDGWKKDGQDLAGSKIEDNWEFGGPSI